MRLALCGVVDNVKLRLVDLDNTSSGFVDADRDIVISALTNGGDIIGIMYSDGDICATDGSISDYPKISSNDGETTNEVVAVSFKDNEFTVVNGTGKFEEMTESMLVDYYNSIGVANISVSENRVITLNGVRILKLNVSEDDIKRTVCKMRVAGVLGFDMTDDGKAYIPEGVEEVKRVVFGGGVVAIRKCGFYDRDIKCKIKLSPGVKVLEDKSFARVKGLSTIDLNYGLEKICKQAFWRSDLESIVIPSTVTVIETEAFKECSKLGTIKLSGSLKVIERATFAECVNLKDITIPYSVKVVKRGAFEGCSKLKNVTLLGGRQVIENGAFPRGAKIEVIT